MTAPPPLPSALKDQEHLRLLSIFHYVVAAIGALFACFPLIHVVIGIMMIVHPESMGKEPPPPFAGYLFAVIGGLFILGGWAYAVCVFLAGRYIAQRRRWLFCLIVAAWSCIFMPFGTVLGVITFIVLLRDSVKPLFERPAPAAIP